jgi:hypothetical protein
VITAAIAFAGASLGLSGLVILWGIAWASRPRPAGKSVIPAVPYSRGQLLDTEA